MPNSTQTQQPQKLEAGKKSKKRELWALKAFLIALFMSVIFSTFSQIALTGANLILALVVLFVFLILSWLSDMVGTAVTVCDITPFMSMASRKIHGAKMSIKLINAQAIVSSICNDIVGDICSIISGAIGASIALQFAFLDSSSLNFFLPIIISGLIAAVTISGKAFGKMYAIAYSHAIIKLVGRILSVFEKRDCKKKPKGGNPKQKEG